MPRSRTPTILGEATLASPWFSNRWTLTSGGDVLAEVRRVARSYVSVARVEGGERITMEPTEAGTVVAVDDDDTEVGRITRRSWWGRHWELGGKGFTYDLVSEHRPRRWHLAVANAPVTHLSGSLLSYNRVRIESPLNVPVTAVLLAWHVIARPWEAANEPRHLAPGRPRRESPAT